ncbi:hypothetical protein FRX31_013797 [Thalictrum thalictroides]|uniref:Uncharacterized protein n=1 Tax=Thalictrum thalictroides TaxID=46969 RepID=A0A7J6WGQ2_THATH|nr:hypothetical protein FRX31_013797 [Thalictrum thalictroides]
MDIQSDMPDSIWLEGPNYPGFWQKIFYPNFVYCSYCSKIGHAWEQCNKRKTVAADKQQENSTLNADMPQTRKNPRVPTWQMQRRARQEKTAYIPKIADASTSGAKDSQGIEILTAPPEKEKEIEAQPAETISNPTQSMAIQQGKQPAVHQQEQSHIETHNAFAALNILGEEDEIIPHIPLRRASTSPSRRIASQPVNEETTQSPVIVTNIEQGLEFVPSNQNQNLDIVLVSEQQNFAANTINPGASISEPQYVNPNLHDGIFIVPPSPLMITNGDITDEEEEENPEYASYGSETEIRGRRLKTYAPTAMITRSRSQGHKPNSKPCFKCCKP